MYDQFPNQVLPSPGTIFSGGGTGVNTYIDPELTSRFIVLWNSYPFFIQAQATGNSPAQASFALYRKCQLPTRWVGSGLAISNMSEGAIYLIITSDNVASTNSHLFNVTSRCNFIDPLLKTSYRGKNFFNKQC